MIASVAVPFAHRGFPGGHDAGTHITYAYLFDRALSQGQFPVRWVEWVRSGESQPLFNFYYPGLYYLIAIVHACGLSLMIALESTVVLLWWAGAAFLFAFLRPWGQLPAVFGAALFALSPYVILDAFVRAAYAELAAVALAPGVLWSCDRLLRGGRVEHALTAAALTSLMLITHLPSVLIFGPVFAAYVVYLTATSQTTLRRIGVLSLAIGLGLGLASFYVLPALGELHLATMSKMTSGYFDYRRHFVAPAQWFSRVWGFGASVEGPHDDLSFQLGIVQSAAVAVGLAYVAAALVRRRITRPAADLLFWLSIVGLALFVMTETSEPLWRVVRPLSYLQFPWRFLMLTSLACAVVAARVLSLVRAPTAQALIVIAAVGFHYSMHWSHLAPARYIPRSETHINDAHWAERPEAQAFAFIDRGFTPLVVEEESPRGLGRWLAEGEGTVTEVRMADDSMVLDVDAPSGMQVRLHTHYFPGWRVWVDGAETEVAVTPVHGFIDVRVPPGTHRLEARFTDTPLRRRANAISSVSVAVCLGVLACCRRSYRPKPPI